MEKTWNVQKNLRYLNLKKKNFEYSREKMMSLLPLMLTNLDKFFIGGTKHHALLPCKISSKSEHVKYQKSLSHFKSFYGILSYSKSF